MSRKGDEYLDYLLDVDGQRPARPKPRYFWGDRRQRDESGEHNAHYDDIPEEQFWNPPKDNK